MSIRVQDKKNSVIPKAVLIQNLAKVNKYNHCVSQIVEKFSRCFKEVGT